MRVNAAVLLALGLLLLGCSPAQEEVPLGFLVLHSGAYQGKTLVVEGVVHHLEEPEHFWLEDGHYNRVGLSPSTKVEDYLGERVQVIGRFQSSSDLGRKLQVQAIERVKFSN